MSSASNRDNSRPSRPAEPAAHGPAAEPPVGSNMLEQILAVAAGSSPAAGFVEPQDVEALRSVAESFAGQPFSLEPVAVELIHAILRVQYQKAGISATTLRAMAQQFAADLYEDPPSRGRLEALWTGLCGR